MVSMRGRKGEWQLHALMLKCGQRHWNHNELCQDEAPTVNLWPTESLSVPSADSYSESESMYYLQAVSWDAWHCYKRDESSVWSALPVA